MKRRGKAQSAYPPYFQCDAPSDSPYAARVLSTGAGCVCAPGSHARSRRVRVPLHNAAKGGAWRIGSCRAACILGVEVTGTVQCGWKPRGKASVCAKNSALPSSSAIDHRLHTILLQITCTLSVQVSSSLQYRQPGGKIGLAPACDFSDERCLQQFLRRDGQCDPPPNFLCVIRHVPSCWSCYLPTLPSLCPGWDKVALLEFDRPAGVSIYSGHKTEVRALLFALFFCACVVARCSTDHHDTVRYAQHQAVTAYFAAPTENRGKSAKDQFLPIDSRKKLAG